MLTRYSDAAKAEGAKRAEELAADGDLAGVAVWLRLSMQSGKSLWKPAVGQFRHPIPREAVLLATPPERSGGARRLRVLSGHE